MGFLSIDYCRSILSLLHLEMVHSVFTSYLEIIVFPLPWPPVFIFFKYSETVVLLSKLELFWRVKGDTKHTWFRDKRYKPRLSPLSWKHIKIPAFMAIRGALWIQVLKGPTCIGKILEEYTANLILIISLRKEAEWSLFYFIHIWMVWIFKNKSMYAFCINILKRNY